MHSLPALSRRWDKKTYTWYIMPFNKFMEAVELLDVVMRLAYRIVQN